MYIDRLSDSRFVIIDALELRLQRHFDLPVFIVVFHSNFLIKTYVNYNEFIGI